VAPWQGRLSSQPGSWAGSCPRVVAPPPSPLAGFFASNGFDRGLAIYPTLRAALMAPRASREDTRTAPGGQSGRPPEGLLAVRPPGRGRGYWPPGRRKGYSWRCLSQSREAWAMSRQP
jgi:hypothetical protein